MPLSARRWPSYGAKHLAATRATEHDAYKEAVRFKEKWEPEDEVVYDWTVEYAKDCYTRMETTFRYMDEKADSLIKYLGGGTAAVTLGTLATVNGANYLLACAVTPPRARAHPSHI